MKPSGWIVAHSRKKQRQDFTPGDSPGPSAGNRAARPAHPKGPINKLIAASRLPRLPKDHYRVVVRPKGGMDVCKPHARNAEAYAKVKQIRVGETLHEVSNYVTPPGDTCRGVVRGIDPELSDDRLGELFVHARNPKVLGVRRIKKTPTVIVLFDEERIRRRIGPAKAGTRFPTSFGVEGDDGEKQTSSARSSCHSKLRGFGSNQGGGLDNPGRGAGHRSRSRDRSASCARIQQEPTWLNEWAQNNCASFHRKKAVLQQFVSSQENKPAVILLQETLKGEVALRGYRSVACWGEGKRGVATLISKEFSFEVRDVRPDLKVEHILIELIPNSRLKEHLFVLNVYSSPSDTRETFNALLCKASKIAGSAPLTVAGDFNAQHQTWGYINNTAKGRALLQHTTNLNMLLVTDHNFPTRLGNSVARDTTPDLAFVRNVECPFWQNLHENLKSDHFIASISLDVK
ncbi:hypothetical protein HPB51_026980 [Rhipicephalus microplus]|uniref:Endonuclease/exonuclease/phosphatase domain-containing protein n=1 Tax=Rhipicephalus microplus TaxID=6941 RepID=A0A9J6D1H8_RHIMP|nr:hypothetical protein HPB51_026980 [Rhipicephalus microplus]